MSTLLHYTYTLYIYIKNVKKKRDSFSSCPHSAYEEKTLSSRLGGGNRSKFSGVSTALAEMEGGGHGL